MHKYIMVLKNKKCHSETHGFIQLIYPNEKNKFSQATETDFRMIDVIKNKTLDGSSPWSLIAPAHTLRANQQGLVSQSSFTGSFSQDSFSSEHSRQVWVVDNLINVWRHP